MRLPRHALGLLIALWILGFSPVAAQSLLAMNAYVATRTFFTTELSRLAAQPDQREAMLALNAKARGALQSRLQALLGPLSFPGFPEPPSFSPGALYPGDVESGRPDGLVFTAEGGDKRLFVSPIPVFADWLSRAVRDGSFPNGREGTQGSLDEDALYTVTVGVDSRFGTAVPLPVAARTGETLHAAIGVFTTDDVPFLLPRSLVVGRLGDGRITVALVSVEDVMAPIPACTRVAKRGIAALNRYRAERRGERRWADAFEGFWNLMRESNAQFEACLARELPRQPYYPALRARIEQVVETVRTP